MNRILVIGALSLLVTACGMQPVRDDSPANDLQALSYAAKQTTKPRLLPNGKEYCVELSDTNGELQTCALDLEDALFLSNKDKQTLQKLIDKAVKRLSLARNPCGWWSRTFTKRVECNPDR